MNAAPAGPELRVVMVRTRNPLNLGAAARAMANFGVHDLVAVDPFGGAWREARSAVGAEGLLKQARQATLPQALSDCALVLGTTAARRREVRQPVVPLPGVRSFLRERLPGPGRVALLFGSEKTGLSNADLHRCHALLSIPTSAAAPSMNLSHALAVTLYELRREDLPAETADPRRTAPTAEQLEDLLQKALAACERLDYMTHLPPAVRAEKLRRALLRWRLGKHDASLLQAFLKRAASPKDDGR